mmetsp:Transcript_4407/g.7840  ORF Transcript_4407/g.7840 Transcript_4407/m.7840 type:complete len:287 (+) Transcript_4407:1171-2031(+)
MIVARSEGLNGVVVVMFMLDDSSLPMASSLSVSVSASAPSLPVEEFESSLVLVLESLPSPVVALPGPSPSSSAWKSMMESLDPVLLEPPPPSSLFVSPPSLPSVLEPPSFALPSVLMESSSVTIMAGVRAVGVPGEVAGEGVGLPELLMGWAGVALLPSPSPPGLLPLLEPSSSGAVDESPSVFPSLPLFPLLSPVGESLLLPSVPALSLSPLLDPSPPVVLSESLISLPTSSSSLPPRPVPSPSLPTDPSSLSSNEFCNGASTSTPALSSPAPTSSSSSSPEPPA